MYLNIALHQFHNVFGNGHAQPCTLHLIDCGILRPGKQVEHVLQKRLVNAIAVIRHGFGYKADARIVRQQTIHFLHHTLDTV